MTDLEPPILLVEDDLDLGESTKLMLEMIGYRVDWVATAPAAADRIARGRYLAALLDLRLGKDDGAEMIRDIRQAGHLIPPVIIISGEPDERLRSSRAMTRAVGVLTKPYRLSALREALKRVGASA